jgi:hypothetical protein
VSPGLERILRHCLEKNPSERFQFARDLEFAPAASAEKNSDRSNKNRSVLAENVFAKSATAGHYCSRLR